MPKFELDICRPKIDFDYVIDTMVFLACVPPMAIFELEDIQRKGREIGLDFAYLVAGFELKLVKASGGSRDF